MDEKKSDGGRACNMSVLQKSILEPRKKKCLKLSISSLRIVVPTCIETVTCPITTPLDFFIQPFLLQLGDWFYVIVWGLIGGIIYNRSGNVMLVGIIGIIIGTSLMGNNLLVQGRGSILILIVMVGMGSGLVLYQLWRQRLNNP